MEINLLNYPKLVFIYFDELIIKIRRKLDIYILSLIV